MHLNLKGVTEFLQGCSSVLHLVSLRCYVSCSIFLFPLGFLLQSTINNIGKGLIFIRQCSTNIANSAFDHNVGSIYTFNSTLTFVGNGNSRFDNSREKLIAGDESTSQEGGVITSFQSTVIFARESKTQFLNNQARDGGAILAIESTILMYGETIIANNSIATLANRRGGGISLKQSRLEIKGKCNLADNSAMRRGGIHATSSTIAVHIPIGTLQIIDNFAELGGGMYLELSSKLYILKMERSSRYFLHFTGNHANNGGAVYVAYDTNSGACSNDNECFIQTLALYESLTFTSNDLEVTENTAVVQGFQKLALTLSQIPTSSELNTVDIFFAENTVTEKGSNLFGGLMDRCIPSPFAEVSQKQSVVTKYIGVTYLKDISNAQIHSISSQPVRVCFCNSEHEPDCSYQLPTITVKKGEAFNVSVVVVDQVNNTVNANITTSISSSEDGFGEGQQTQSVGRNCTDLTYNGFSPHNNETINLFADGLCGSAALSTSHVYNCPIHRLHMPSWLSATFQQ